MELAQVFALGSYWEALKNYVVIGLGLEMGTHEALLKQMKENRALLESMGIVKGVCKSMSGWLEKMEKSFDPKSKRITMDSGERRNLEIDYYTWTAIIAQEIAKIPLIAIETQKGLDPNELRKVSEKQPSEFFTPETWNRLSKLEASDLSDAAKCLLVGTATPAVMVVLRAGEASLRRYYEHETGSQSGSRTWRQLTMDLQQRREELEIEESFIGYLDYYGEAKRNIAQHPNRIYSLREATMIFMQVAAMIEDIYLQILN